VGTANDEGLIVYSKACRALAAARSTDEVKKIRTQAGMLRAYAKQAKNRQLEVDAVEIRIRAERRLGELIQAQKQTVGLSKGTRGQLRGRDRSGGTKVDPPESLLATLADNGIDKHLAERGRKLAKMPEDRFERNISDWRASAVDDPTSRVTADILKPSMAVHHSSETPEHYTPTVIIDATIDCFEGCIDLDPCSNPGKPTVPALNYFTKADDGLQQSWRGKVYMNPPYGREIDEWVDKLLLEATSGEVTEAIALVPARTDTQWFVSLRDHVCCFVEGRLTFIGNGDPAPFPSAVFYIGEHVDRFFHAFHAIGDIWQRIEPGMFGE
jgi:hypothetical protein